MARAALLVALIALAPHLPEGCAKMLGKGQASSQATPSAEPKPQPVPLVSATATAPPVWAPPETAAPPPPAAPAPAVSAVGPDLAKARALAQSGDHKKVRALLEKKVKAGKANREEATVLMESCLILRDKACVEAVKAKHPDVEGP